MAYFAPFNAKWQRRSPTSLNGSLSIGSWSPPMRPRLAMFELPEPRIPQQSPPRRACISSLLDCTGSRTDRRPDHIRKSGSAASEWRHFSGESPHGSCLFGSSRYARERSPTAYGTVANPSSFPFRCWCIDTPQHGPSANLLLVGSPALIRSTVQRIIHAAAVLLGAASHRIGSRRLDAQSTAVRHFPDTSR